MTTQFQCWWRAWLQRLQHHQGSIFHDPEIINGPFKDGDKTTELIGAEETCDPREKASMLPSQYLLLSSKRVKCRNESHQRLRQFLSPREDWLTTKPRRNNFTWSKSDHRISRLRKARRLTCPRSQLMAHYDAKRKVHRPEYYGLTPHQK